MLMLDDDVTVFKHSKGVTCIRHQFFDYPVNVTRKPKHVNDGIDEISIEFAAGGRVTVFTTRPLLWVEPERH